MLLQIDLMRLKPKQKKCKTQKKKTSLKIIPIHQDLRPPRPCRHITQRDREKDVGILLFLLLLDVFSFLLFCLSILSSSSLTLPYLFLQGCKLGPSLPSKDRYRSSTPSSRFQGSGSKIREHLLKANVQFPPFYFNRFLFITANPFDNRWSYSQERAS